MKHSYTTGEAELFYQSLGKLFYAIAAADKVIKPEEIEALESLVKKEWLEVDAYQDQFGSDAAYQIEITFDWLAQNQMLASEAFEDFADYKKLNDNKFDNSLNQLILKTAEKIASSFAGKNKSELIMLSKLESIL
jgi:hypothetical protein